MTILVAYGLNTLGMKYSSSSKSILQIIFYDYVHLWVPLRWKMKVSERYQNTTKKRKDVFILEENFLMLLLMFFIFMLFHQTTCWDTSCTLRREYVVSLTIFEDVDQNKHIRYNRGISSITIYFNEQYRKICVRIQLHYQSLP